MTSRRRVMSETPSIYDEISVVDLPPEPSGSLEREDKSDFVEAIRMEKFDTALPSEPSGNLDDDITNLRHYAYGDRYAEFYEQVRNLIAERERLAKIEVLKKVNKPGVESYLIADELRNLEGTKDE